MLQSLPILQEQPQSADVWKTHLRLGVRDLTVLHAQGLLSQNELDSLRGVETQFQMLVNRYYFSLIDWSNPTCPIRLQAIPSERESATQAWESRDPIGDDKHSPVPGLVHRYTDRALLFPTYKCPMYCRYCFRKSILNEEPIRLRQNLPAILSYLRAASDVSEVILTGGDPLILSTKILDDLLSKLQDIKHIRRVRIHSRFPVTLPQRIDVPLVQMLGQRGLVKLVTHFNHPREITTEAVRALSLLQLSGVELANQAVLLRGVNDSASILAELFLRLNDCGVTPYYLHHLDAAPGTAHFRTSVKRGLEIYREFLSMMGDVTPPKYVIDIPGGGGKIALDGPMVAPGQLEGEYLLSSPVDGHVHSWVDPATCVAADNTC